MPTHTPVLIDELFGELKPASGDERWIVVHTKPRCEKKLAEYARNNGITYYLPQMESRRIYQRRKVTTTRPMFPGYLFCVVDPAKKQTLVISGYTVSFIRVPWQQELLEELVNLRRSTQPKPELENALWLSQGIKVEITSGPLKGVTGIVESHEKMSEVRLQVNILRQAVMIRVDPRNLKIIGEYVIEEE
ncbi:MAG: transcription termination/antitermination NusG family protein [Candidatus Syntrophosphaera sp.]